MYKEKGKNQLGYININSELKKGGNMGNKFPEPMSVFRNQVIRQGRNMQESLKLKLKPPKIWHLR